MFASGGYLEYYKKTGFYPHPRKLLGLLLFQEREKYITHISGEIEFYLHHEQSIMEKINKVLKDFSITEEMLDKMTKLLRHSNINSTSGLFKGRIYWTFSIALSNLYKSLFNNEDLTDAEMFNYYFDETEVVFKDDTIPSLNELYDYYLSEFEVTGMHPHPSELLGILLLLEREKYSQVECSFDEFYDFYKEQIKEKINQVIKDFNITKQEMNRYIKKKYSHYEEEDYDEEEYEDYKTFDVFGKGFEGLYDANRKCQGMTIEEIHNELSMYFNRRSLARVEILKQPPFNPKCRKRKNNSNPSNRF